MYQFAIQILAALPICEVVTTDTTATIFIDYAKATPGAADVEVVIDLIQHLNVLNDSLSVVWGKSRVVSGIIYGFGDKTLSVYWKDHI